jgi:hypothetical protein
MLRGSMQPREIEWDLPLALGLQLQTEWWETQYDPHSQRGIPCRRVKATKRNQGDLLG